MTKKQMTKKPKSSELKLERSLRAPIQKVWRALTRGEEIARWFGPSDEFRIEVLEWDCRSGGEYRVVMHDPDGKAYTCFGAFRDVEEPRRLTYTWSWEGQSPMDTLVAFELAEDGSATRLSFRHTGFPSDEARDQHEQGWTGSLERLSRLIA